MSELIKCEIEDGIAIVSIDRPEKRNAMTYEMLSDFVSTFDDVGRNDEVSVVILTGRGGAFCAGTDLADLDRRPSEQRGAGDQAAAGHPWPIAACPKPVIGAIDGPAVGMGAELTSQCDIRLASTRARFAWNFVDRGLVPDTGAGTWLLPRLIGVSQAFWLLYSGEFISAREAHELGYVSAVVEPEELMDAALTMAESFKQGSPFSQRRIKELMYTGMGLELGEHMKNHAKAMMECFQSEDHREGVASFLEKRAPHFTGR